MGNLRRNAAIGLSLGALALGAGAVFTATPVEATKPPVTDKVTLCHATNSNSNPYVQVTVSENSTQLAGHEHDNGPVWNPFLKALHIKWGDIIPSENDVTGKNWGPTGQRIWHNGCSVVFTTPTPTPHPTSTPTPTPTATPTATPTPTPTPTPVVTTTTTTTTDNVVFVLIDGKCVPDPDVDVKGEPETDVDVPCDPVTTPTPSPTATTTTTTTTTETTTNATTTTPVVTLHNSSSTSTVAPKPPTPNTGADVPYLPAGGLVLAGLGTILGAAVRRRRNS